MRVLKVICLIIISTIFMYSYKLGISNKDFKDIKEYSEENLDIINSLDVDINELNKQYPIERIRQNENNFQVIYRSSQSVLILNYSLNGKKNYSNKYTTTKLKDDFNKITIGNTIDFVQKFDKDGSFPFMYIGRNDLPLISYHYTMDGYLIELTYDDDFRVMDIATNLL